MNTITHFSRFQLNPTRNGGCRRTAQIHEAFGGLDVTFIQLTAVMPPKISFLSRIRHWFRVYNRKKIRSRGQFALWTPDYRPYVYLNHLKSLLWAQAMRQDSGIELVIIDDPVFFEPLVKKFKKYAIPMVALCQNIESLVSGQTTTSGQKELFKREIEILSLCDLIVTVSQDDAAILKKFNLNVIHFPYYPAKSVALRLEKIKEARQRTSKRNFLALGSTNNIPTKNGMIRLIEEWTKRGLSRTGDQLLVAGFGTENIKDVAEQDGVQYLGPLPSETLEKTLSEVKACVCYQESTTGVLVRISEMLMANVPVVVNSEAARYYRGQPGIIEFQNFEKLEEALSKIGSAKDTISDPKFPDPSELLDAIETLRRQPSGKKEVV